MVDIRWLVLSSLCILVVACSPHANSENENADALEHQFCVIAPSECDSKLAQKVYLTPSDVIYERKIHGRQLRIPFGYLSTTEMIVDPRYSKEESSLYLEALMPTLEPHNAQNLREFFMPYERSRIGIQVWIHRPNAIPWEEMVKSVVQSNIQMSYQTAIRRPDKFGLQVWGENFQKWPRRVPCKQLGESVPCETPSPTKDVLTPAVPNGPPSVITCDPDELDDIDQTIVAMKPADREAYFSSGTWIGKRRAMCRHQMYYETTNISLWLDYPRRFLPQWKESENRVRALFDSFLVEKNPSEK